jgi:regulatory LuxR family protein
MREDEASFRLFPYGLTAREVEVLRLVVKGLTNTQVAEGWYSVLAPTIHTSVPSTTSWALPRAARQPAMPLSTTSLEILLALL